MKYLLSLILCASFFPVSGRAETAVGQRFKRVIQVVFENTDYEGAMGEPNFAALLQQGAFFTNFHAAAHPSQANYIAMIAGDTLGVLDGDPVVLDATHLGDLLEQAGLGWRVYADDYPGNCFTGELSGRYVRRHNPFISFLNVSQNPARCANILDSTGFDLGVSTRALPAFTMYVPDLDNDGHDTGVDFAGRWMAKRFGPMLADKAFMKDTLFIVTFDESEDWSENHIYTVVLGGAVKPGSTFNGLVNHASLLRLIEDEFHLGSLNRGDASSIAIEGIWK
jgi:hypothetical protein